MACSWNSFEVAKLLVSLSTPIVVALVGWKLLRTVESIKSREARRSTLSQRRADQFFSSCEDFMNSFERVLSIIAMVNAHHTSKETTYRKFVADCVEQKLHLETSLLELQNKIERNLIFAPKNRDVVSAAVNACMETYRNQTKVNQFNGKELTGKQSELNKAASLAYEEILNLNH